MTRLQACIVLTICTFLSASIAFAHEGQLYPSPINSDAEINEIQRQLSTIQLNISMLSNPILEGNYSNDLQVQITKLESELHNIRSQLDKQQSEEENGKNKHQLTNLYNKLNNEIHILQECITIKVDSGVNPRTPKEIKVNMESHQFEEARNKINQIGASSPMIKLIVYYIYAKNIQNFDLLNDFIKASKDVAISYSILSALWYEMKGSDHIDVYKLIGLYETLVSEFISTNNITDEMKNNVNRIQNEIYDNIVINAAETLKTAVGAENYEGNHDIQRLKKSLCTFNDNISDAIMRKVIDDIYDITPKERLVRYMNDNDCISQIVGALVHIFEKMQKNKDLDGNLTMMIAQNIKKLQEIQNYNSSVTGEKKDKVQDIINNLPKSVYALYFSEKVCIKNVYHNKYIYSSHHRSQRNHEIRYVFTWGDGQIPLEGTWFVKVNENFTYKFVNEKHKNEYIYVPISEMYKENYRYVWTWKPENILDDQSTWKIDLDGDEVIITNKYFQERLCATEEDKGYWRRYVYTMKEEPNTYSKECRWYIEACV